MENLSQIISYIAELPSKGIFLGLKIFFITLSLFLISGIIYFLLITDWFEKRFAYDLFDLLRVKPYKKNKMAKRWQKIKARINKKDEAERKLAVIEAQNFLEKVLARRGFKGKTFLEKLEDMGPDILSSEKLDELLYAHQIRNNIVYDPDYKLKEQEARKVIEIFEKTWQEFSGTG